MILVLASKNDPAAVNIHRYLQRTYDFQESSIICDVGPVIEYQGVFLLEIGEEIVTTNLAHVEKDLKPDLVVVLSRHRAESGTPALLAHPQGNWGRNVTLGGQPETISMTSATALKIAIMALKKQKDQLQLHKYLCGLEITHHGPVSTVPMIFIEIGSSKSEWINPRAAEAVGEATMHVARKWLHFFPAVVGVGGTHYAPRFNELINRTPFAVSHIMPKYVLDSVELPGMLKQAVSKTKEQVKICAYDHGGTKSTHRKQAREIAEDLGLKFTRVRDLLRNYS